MEYRDFVEQVKNQIQDYRRRPDQFDARHVHGGERPCRTARGGCG
jgi:hypothetical protein